ncbi:MAG: O-antigen ligase family protein, partial [Acidimicrobiales bacterium]
LVGVMAAAIGIGIIERITGSGWANYLSEHIPAAFRASYIFPLGTRGGVVRAQAASAFGLEFGWVMTMLLPLLAVAVAVWIGRNRSWGARRHLLLLLPLAAVAAVIFSSSRSADVGVAGSAILLLAFAGAPRWLTTSLAGAVLVVLLVVAGTPSLITSAFTAAAHSNSISGRLQRLPILFDLVVHRPFVGAGYSGPSSLFIGVDDGYASTYIQLGMIGLLSWLVVLAAAVATALRTLRAPRGTTTRELGAACAIGIMAVAVAMGGYDVTGAEQSMWTLALLGALAVVLAEQVQRRPRAARSPARALIPLAGAVAGVVVLALAPIGWSRSFTVYVLSPSELAAATTNANFGWSATDLAAAVCGYLEAPSRREPGTALRCDQPNHVAPSIWPAEVAVRIGGGSPGAVTSETHRAFGALKAPGYPTVIPDGPIVSGSPAWALTAPLSGAVAGMMAALLVPTITRRRRFHALRPAFDS